MKEIKAYIKPHKLTNVTMNLQKIDGLTGVSISNVRGFGRSRAKNAPDKFSEDSIDLIPRIKIEIVCKNELVDLIVATIEKTAHTGLRGDGKIYVSDVDAAVRISTGEHGERAI
ncbi:MAG: P-II family nitrogen regulator [Syntrophobacter sp.]